MINLGDLFVFIAVIFIVAVFLKAAHSFVSESEKAAKPAAPPIGEPQNPSRNRPHRAEAEEVTSSRPVS